MKRTFLISRSNPRWRDVLSGMSQYVYEESARYDVRVVVDEPLRSDDSNAKMWAMLHDVSAQVEWPVDGVMQKLPAEDWKAILTAGLKRSQRIAQGIEGGVVVLGSRTSRMTQKRMSELMELIQFFGDSKQVRWSDPKRADPSYEQMAERAC